MGKGFLFLRYALCVMRYALCVMQNYFFNTQIRCQERILEPTYDLQTSFNPLKQA
ncbi:hypothetical protein [Empedobacter falsenii]|uniref:hypothetical protein n=1 Tax=Empedobacter falsenii TaxID=343874 RepID=UPI001C8D5BA2|nr:hypothetical protein [Empedobacter falsenii]MBY0065626.1 hypothetical protein [Empedobacter falsenii]